MEEEFLTRFVNEDDDLEDTNGIWNDDDDDDTDDDTDDDIEDDIEDDEMAEEE